MHKWTEELWSCENKDRFDVTLKSLLTKKAEELVCPGSTTSGIAMGYAKSRVRRILGLEEDRSGEVNKTMEAKVEKEKCDHLEMFEDTGDVEFMHKNGKGGCFRMSYEKFRFCPLCGKERPTSPKKKTLAEVLNQAGGWSNQVDYNDVAKAALSYFREIVESQPISKGAVMLASKEFKDELLRKLAQEQEAV